MLEGLLKNLETEQKEEFEFITKYDVMDLLKCSRTKVEKMMRNNTLKYYKIGKMIRFNKHDIIEYVKTFEVKL